MLHQETARQRLQKLTDENALARIDLGARQTIWVRNDFSAAADVADKFAEYFDLPALHTEHLAAFGEEPYCLLPKDQNAAYVIVPRFVPFHIGWLDRQTSAYNVFVVNKYVDWIEEIPNDIRKEVGISAKYEAPTVADGILEVDPAEREEAWNEFSDERHQNAIPPDNILHDESETPWNQLRSLASRLDILEQGMSRAQIEHALAAERDEFQIRINPASEFEVIAGLIEDGNLPFRPEPVTEEDLRPEPDKVRLDNPEHVPENADFQTRAWERFLQTGMVGVYWPPSAGKTFLALYAGERLHGSKLVVVPNNTVGEQWEQRIEKFCSDINEWEVQTYQYIRTQDNIDDYETDGPVLTIFDEAHHLPADTYATISTIDTDYRMGLSASPHREDERTDYIFALTGYPVGLEWQELVALGVVNTPPAQLYLYRQSDQKQRDVAQIVDERTGKILILCDSLDKGHEIADDLGVPFVYGETTSRMDVFANNRVVVASRVADEGVSLQNLDVVVEHDFHGRSRRQETQRYGRVMHGQSQGEYIIQMTDAEYEKYSKRLLALEQHGIDIVTQRRE